MNKSFKNFLRSWLALTSMAGCLMGWVFIARASERNDPAEIPASATPTELQLTPLPNLDDLVASVPAPTRSLKTFRLSLPNQPTSLPPTASTNQVPPTGVPTLLQATLAPILTPTEQPTGTPTYVPTSASNPDQILAPTPTRPTVNMPPRLRTSGS